MLYKGNNKIGKVYLGDTSIGKIYLGDELVYQKEKPAPKRVKSVTISLPAWGNAERVWWESVPRAVKDTSSGYYLDITIGGVGFRLRGKGGSKRATLSVSSTTAKITLPDNVVITEDKVYSGMSLSLTTKMPPTTSKATYTSSNDSYKKHATFWFDNAPFIPGTKLKGHVTRRRIGDTATSVTIEASLTGGFPNTPVIKSTHALSDGTRFEEKSYNASEFQKLATHGVSYLVTFAPLFIFTTNGNATIGKDPTLVTPEATHKFSMKVTKVETF
jgi:hypothetical protein